MAKQKVRADIILRQLAKRHNGKVPDAFFTEVKNGPTLISNKDGLLIMDAIAIKPSWTKPCITGYEVKVSRQDFIRDEKWPGYRKYCHRLSFACPAGLIAPEELPDDIGLIYYNPDKDCISTKRTPAFRSIEIPWEMLYYLVISRLEKDRHPFFSDQREFLQAWLQDKEDRKRLGYLINTKMIQQLAEANEKAADAARELKRKEDDLSLLGRVEEVLKRHGIRTSVWSLDRDLEAALSNAMSPEMVRGLERIEQEVGRIMKTFSGKEAQ